MEEKKKKGCLAFLLEYAGGHKALTFIGLALSSVSMLLSMAPYVCVWLSIRELLAAAPDFSKAAEAMRYGWIAFAFAFGGIAIYFAGLMCTHLAAFRTATNIRKAGAAHLMKAPLGFFGDNASGLIRSRLDTAVADTESLLAHNLADIAGTAVMFVGTVAMMFAFDLRMGAACLLAAVISIISLCSMMGGDNAKFMAEFQAALDRVSKAGTEYVRGIPVVKVFQQTVYSFKAFQAAIRDYSRYASDYSARGCAKPQTVNTTFTEGAFVFLVPAALLLAPSALAKGDFALFVADFAFYAVFSAVISTALAKVMFAAGGMMQADAAVGRIRQVLAAPTLEEAVNPQEPRGNKIEFRNVSFTYKGAASPALVNLSFVAEEGKVTALVGPSGGGKTTAASLILRFWDASAGAVLIGGVDARQIATAALMRRVAFVFQDSRLFKASVFENVRLSRPDAAEDEVRSALKAAQCDGIIAKLPDGANTIIGSGGAHLSGGEKQRVALARAILKNAPIVVLDEATAFADPENEALIQKAFAELMRGRTVIMIAHRLSTVTTADKIVVLDKGHLVEEGRHEELKAAGGLYAQMWEEYVQAAEWKIKS